MQALVFVGLLTLGWQPPTEVAEADPSPLQVDSVLVTLIEQVEAPAQEPGVLANVAVREGQIVAVGDLLAQIDDRAARQLEGRAKIELESARRLASADLDVQLAQKILERAKSQQQRAAQSVAIAAQSVSPAELQELRLEVDRSALALEKAKQEFELAQFSVSLKESDLAAAAHAVERRRIISPLAGVVVQVRRRNGEWVEPGETVVRILRIDRLRVEGFVKSGDVAADLTARRAVLRLDGKEHEGATFEGTVVFVAPEIDPVNGQVRMWAEFDNPDLLLRPGQRGTMTIEGAVQGSPE